MKDTLTVDRTLPAPPIGFFAPSGVDGVDWAPMTLAHFVQREEFVFSATTWGAAHVSTKRAPWLSENLDTTDLDAVCRFVDSHEGSRTAVRETREALQGHFPANRIRLWLYEDPDGEVGDHLVLSVVWEGDDVDRALERRDAFDEAFWFDRLAEFGNVLGVEVVFD